MTVTTNVDKIKINLLTQDQYDSITKSPTELYFITDNDTRYVKTSELAEVAISGDYNDLDNTPNLAEVAISGDYTDLDNTPNLAEVATSGSYNDLSNKPTIPVVDQTFNDSSSNSQSGIAIKNYLDSTVVHLSGDETIGGAKTFTDQTTFTINDDDIRLFNEYTNYTKGTAPSNTQYSGIRINDSNGTEMNSFFGRINKNHTNSTIMIVKNPGDDDYTDPDARIAVHYPANGTPYTEVLSPTSSATGNTNSKEIATCGWVNTLDSGVVHTSGNETISGKKIFTDGCYANGSWSVERTDFVKGDIPASTKYFGIMGLDVKPNDSTSTAWEDRRLGIIETCINTSGETQTYLATYKNATNANGGGNNFRITLHYPASGSGYADITSSPATGDNSTKIATTAFVKAQGYTTNTGTITGIKMNGTSMGTSGVVDLGTVITSHQSLSNYVTLNGSQTISGAKTFTAVPTISGTSPSLTLKNTGITKGTAPKSANTKDVIYIRDNANKNMGYIRSQYATDGTTLLYLNTVRSSSATDGTARGIRIAATTASVYQVTPGSDNDVYLGYTSLRWKQVYAGTTSISTSDERLKQQITDIPDEVLDAWGNVGFCQFKFNDAVEEKGENARFHTGLIAQRIKEVFEEADIDPFSYGLLCYDEWEAEDAVYDEDGNLDTPAKEAGNRYSLRYEECLCMECAYQRRKNQQLEERIARLEKLIN